MKMITTVLEWSTDIDAAPRGEIVEKVVDVQRNGKRERRVYEEYVPTKILALTKCGKIVVTHYIPPRFTQSGSKLDGDRWSVFAANEAPVMWAAMPSAEILQSFLGGSYDTAA
ncbi:hypothetical protein [Rhizobium alvei]|uniref:Phage protein n=1 Tax=Rhizobium alvei TaxID=1132659 RepID=A0ABT8YUJ6_9HYPH|nr:hypothetical protein [Rhizobium alvei]MDO6966953.1 hypothetical protein [Rhizobium alvei]